MIFTQLGLLGLVSTLALLAYGFTNLLEGHFDLLGNTFKMAIQIVLMITALSSIGMIFNSHGDKRFGLLVLLLTVLLAVIASYFFFSSWGSGLV